MFTDEEIMAQVLAAFQEEEAEHRQAITDILLELEREADQPNRKDILDQLFREAHSLKGGARAAGIESVEHIAHRMEDLFSAVRQGKLQLTPTVCDAVYEAVDAIGALMTHVSAGQATTLAAHQHVIHNLSRALGEGPPHDSPTVPETEPDEPAPPDVQDDDGQAIVLPDPSPRPAVVEVPVHPPTVHAPHATLEKPTVSLQPPDAVQPREAQPPVPIPHPTPPASNENHPESVTTVRLSTTTLDNLLNETGELITCSVRSQQRAREAHRLADMPVRWKRVWRQTRPVFNRLKNAVPTLKPTVHHLIDRETETTDTPHLAKLNQGEIGQLSALPAQLTTLLEALAQANTLINDMEQCLAAYARQSTEDYTRLSVVTDRLHDQIRRTRMLPLATLFNPLRLQLREIARAADKQVTLELDDGGAEADRQVLERLREVLLHLLRNAVDHGIEPPDLRVNRGKPVAGCIQLRASVSGDYLTVEVEDDGAGLDMEAIKEGAINAGIAGETDLVRTTESELVDLIFLPGFSTRQTVSKMSGRGVGLDVVRSQVERMQGRVSVQSVSGAGCCFTINVPLSLTSSHGLLLNVDHATYMLPLDSLYRIVAVKPGDIKVLEGRTCLMIDERPLALVHLSDLLGKGDHAGPKGERRTGNGKTSGMLVDGRSTSGGGWSLALLLGSGERQVACMVDGVLGEQELVVYRLPAPLLRVRFIAGATILADGSVVPILDVVDLVRAAIGARYVIDLKPATPTADRPPTILVVDDSITTRTLEKNILEAAGYLVKLATDGKEALETLHHLIENGGCDLLLSDIDMPRLNGFDLTSQVRADPSLKNIPIVLVTSLDSPSDRERGIAAGADAYIVKRAFDQQALLDTIEQLI